MDDHLDVLIFINPKIEHYKVPIRINIAINAMFPTTQIRFQDDIIFDDRMHHVDIPCDDEC